jgi:hypothetical protein
MRHRDRYTYRITHSLVKMKAFRSSSIHLPWKVSFRAGLKGALGGSSSVARQLDAMIAAWRAPPLSIYVTQCSRAHKRYWSMIQWPDEMIHDGTDHERKRSGALCQSLVVNVLRECTLTTHISWHDACRMFSSFDVSLLLVDEEHIASCSLCPSISRVSNGA